MPKKDMGLSKVKYFDPKKVLKIAQQHVTKLRSRQEKGIDFQGNQMPEYSESYKKLIKNDFRKKDGTRLKGYKGIPGVGGGKISKRPLWLRGLTAKAIRQISAKSDYYEIGWTESEYASIMKWNEEKGRDMVSGVPDKEFNWVVNEYGKLAEGDWRKKIKNTTIVVGK